MEDILKELRLVNKKIDDINNVLNIIHLNQIRLDDKINKIIDLNIDKTLNELKNNSDNMNTHISFIENVYETVKTPFYFILNKVSKIENVPVKNIKYIQDT